MAGAAKKRAKQARADNRGGIGSSETAGHESQNNGTPIPLAAFDGPSDTRVPSQGLSEASRGRRMSNAPPSRAPSAVRSTLHDPAREPRFNKNIDLPGNAYNIYSQYELPTTLPRRPDFNDTGDNCTVAINSYPVLEYPTKTVFQYDVLIGSGVEKRGLVKALWQSKTLQESLKGGWIFDGNRLAWALRDVNDEINMEIDLDAEKGQQSREGRTNRHRVMIRKTGAVNMAALKGYIEGQMVFDNSILEAINFLDHLLRETPSKNMFAIKRSFFHPLMVERSSISGGVEAMKGVYQSIRLGQQRNLVVNVDVSNSTFWGGWQLPIIAQQVSGARDFNDLGNMACQQVRENINAPFKDHKFLVLLKKLKKTKFYVLHRGLSSRTKTFIIKDISLKNARQWTFNMKDSKTGKEIDNISIFDYFQRKYSIHLEWPGLPVIETTKKGVAFPMEVCILEEGQRYPFKLGPRQTSDMIKFAVSRPDKRLKAIEGGLKLLNWSGDRYLANYGLKMSDKMLVTNAKLLKPPQVAFTNKTETPMYSGRWRLDTGNKKFATSNFAPLESWGVCIINGLGYNIASSNLELGEAQYFISKFVDTYKALGGKVTLTQPPIITYPAGQAGKAVHDVFLAAGNKTNKRPQMLVFLLSGVEAFEYLRIKKSADCRFGVVSQCMQSVHVKRAQAQYMSNVCMKFNAKLGGSTAYVPTKLGDAGHFKVPTMIIGADVSHASPGSMQPSMAAITASIDKRAVRYAAACETNGHRVEMITTFNIERRFPQHVIYFRDGVSEGQFQHVLQQEVRDIKRIFETLAKGNPALKGSGIRMTVIVASKRHHIRFFPPSNSKAHDSNGNPCPGTLVERDITHPFEYDFYLNSHSAIQGTARPTHYHVLMDESGQKPAYIQNMIYEQCYQYVRSTTPVSLFPAVYYAHLASNRARAHEDISSSLGPHTNKEEQKMKLQSANSSEKPPTEFPPLLPMDNANGIQFTMWYI